MTTPSSSRQKDLLEEARQTGRIQTIGAQSDLELDSAEVDVTCRDRFLYFEQILFLHSHAQISERCTFSLSFKQKKHK
jgi:hypothetical protein